MAPRISAERAIILTEGVNDLYDHYYIISIQYQTWQLTLVRGRRAPKRFGNVSVKRFCLKIYSQTKGWMFPVRWCVVPAHLQIDATVRIGKRSDTETVGRLELG